MRVCFASQKTGYVTLAILGMPLPAEETLPDGNLGVRYYESTEPLPQLCGDALPQEPVMAVSALSELVMEACPDSLMEVSPEPVTEAPKGPLTGGPRGPLKDVAQEPVVGACPASLAEAWAQFNFVGRVLDECLEMEKNRKPTLTARQEMEVVRMATAAILKTVYERESITDVSISDFEGCSFRCLKLASLICEWQDREHGGFTELIARLEELVSRPADLSDTWFLAGVVQIFSSARYLYRWLPLTVSPQSGWGCRKMVFRVSFPDDVLHLPESEDCVKRVCASSKLDWWFHQAIGNICRDEETWQLRGWPAALFKNYRDLGKRTFDDAIRAMRHIIRPPSHLSDLKFMGCLLKYVETTSAMKTGRRRAAHNPEATRLSSSGDPLPSSFDSSPAPACSTRPWVDASRLIDPDHSDYPDRSLAAEMTSFVAGVLKECAERESNEKAVLTVEMKLDIAKFAAQIFRTALLLKKSVERNGRNRDPFEACGWRWLCLVGLMNDYLEPELLRQIISDSEKIVPRPKHVSPLWYLACRMPASVDGRRVATRFKSWLKEPPAWWPVSSGIYQDHFPHEFGELPMSKTSARLIAFSSRAAHWLASGIGNFRVTSKTWIPSKNADIVNIFHTSLGDQRFSQMIDLVKPKFHAIIQAPELIAELTDRSIMEVLCKYASIHRKPAYKFCKDWQFDVPSEKSDLSMDLSTDTSEDEPPPKKTRSG